jgi:predicted patatin/cPLA2 family phospholipase
MRGIFLTGVLHAFSDRKYSPWKLLIGSSAGALTGTAYITGQIHLARDAYFTKLLTGKFIQLSNIFSREKHVLDLDWMVNTIIQGTEPFDMSRLKTLPPVLITATNCPDNKAPYTVYLNSRKDDIHTALKATAAIPFLYRGFVEYKGYHLLDGGHLDPIPYKKALELGYKKEDILVIVTRPKGYRKKEESYWIKTLYESYYKEERYRHLVESLNNRYLMYNKILDELETEYSDIHVIYPPAEFEVDRLTRDPKKILEGFEHGVAEAVKFLNKKKD